MATGEAEIDGKTVYTMYPTIVHKDGEYTDFRFGGNHPDPDPEGGAKAWQYASENDEYIGFDTKEEAEWAERNWKRLWGDEPRANTSLSPTE